MQRDKFMTDYNAKNQTGNILVVHPNEYMRKALILVLKKYCGSVLKERGWQNLSIREAASIEEVVHYKEKGNIKVFITHLERVSPDSRDISIIRQLRMDGICSPLIAMSFSVLNTHKVFNEKGHRLLIYPFQLIHLKDILQQIRPLESKAIGGFLQRIFCDISYLETLFSAINHSVGHKKWDQVEMDIRRIETYFGDKIVQELKDEINNLFIKKTDNNIQVWQKCFDQIKEEIVCRTKY